VRRLVWLLAAVLAFGACGGEESATDVLGETADNLSEIRSGDLSLELMFAAKSGERQGFRLAGPFALDGGELPVAELEYTQIAGNRATNLTFISTGEEAFVEIGGTAYELPPDLIAEVKEATGDVEAEGLGEEIELGDWIQDPELTDGGEVAGVETDRVSARLDVVNAVNGLMEIAADFGGLEPPPAVEGQGAEQVQRAVESALIDVWTGKDDRLLRKLTLAVDFTPQVPGEVRNVLGIAVDFELEISDPNKDVTVSAPDNPRPFSELPAG
jgi:hypothetical protein